MGRKPPKVSDSPDEKAACSGFASLITVIPAHLLREPEERRVLSCWATSKAVAGCKPRPS